MPCLIAGCAANLPFGQADIPERIGAGLFDPSEHLYAEKELTDFLEVPFEALIDECRRIALRPNMQELAGVDIAGSNNNSIYLITNLVRARNGHSGRAR